MTIDRLTFLSRELRMFRQAGWRERAELADSPYFIEALDDMSELLGTRLETFLGCHTMAILTPDTIVARRIEAALDLFDAHGFVPVAACAVRYSRNIVREFWRQQQHVLLRAARRLIDLYLPSSPSLLVILRDQRATADVPAAARLHALKGPALFTARKAHHLRARLAPRLPLLNALHAPDTIPELVHNLGVFVPEGERRALLRRIAAPHEHDTAVRPAGRALYDASIAHDLDPDASAARLRMRPGGGAGATATADALIRAAHDGDVAAWQALADLCGDDVAGSELWDLVVLGAHALRHRALAQSKQPWTAALKGLGRASTRLRKDAVNRYAGATKGRKKPSYEDRATTARASCVSVMLSKAETQQ